MSALSSTPSDSFEALPNHSKSTPRPPPSPPKPILPTSSFSSKRHTVLLPSPLPTPAKTPTPLTPPPSTATASSAPSTCLSFAPPPASSPIRCPPGASPASSASSPTPLRPSPRAHITSCWRHYHGDTNWTGLLDPLDENLRRELVCYGDLVQAAYHAFHSHPAAPVDAPCHVALLNRSYHITHSLFTTSSVEIPCYLDRLVPLG